MLLTYEFQELARRCESRRGRHIEMSGEDIGIEGEQEREF